ncbi:hypothetical protein V5F34_01110 [Xanthobacter autotrophicus]|uniref:hypothetical protein n=1 Tax=Xanthobacter autotrophicus TaxID=280 RepID=UPI003726C814
MRRLALLLLFIPFAQVAHGAEVLTTPKRYEECLIANGSMLYTAGGDGKVANSVEGAYKTSCLYTGPNKTETEVAAINAATKAIPDIVKNLYQTNDASFTQHASCVSDKAFSIIHTQGRSDLPAYLITLQAARRGLKGCPDLTAAHKHDAWEVIVVAQMYMAEKIEAGSDAAHYSAKIEIKFPQIDVDKLCDRYAGGGNLSVNACIDRNQAGYTRLRAVWPLVSETAFEKCGATVRQYEGTHGYDLWADCVSNYIYMDQIAKDRAERRRFQP